MESLGGPPTPAVGWAAGIERLAMLVSDAGSVGQEWFEFAVIPAGDAAELACAQLLVALRRKGLSSDMSFRGNMKKRMQRANASGAVAALIIGEDELASDAVTVRDLKSGEQERRPLKEVLDPRVGATMTRSLLLAGMGGRLPLL